MPKIEEIAKKLIKVKAGLGEVISSNDDNRGHRPEPPKRRANRSMEHTTKERIQLRRPSDD